MMALETCGRGLLRARRAAIRLDFAECCGASSSDKNDELGDFWLISGFFAL
jgi:hypothetical protein